MLITAFEVAPEADEAFAAAWTGGGRLHRALRRDADFRFVAIGAEEPQDVPFPAHGGAYEVVHEDGDVDGSGGTVLVNPFEVAEADDGAFLAAWDEAREALAGRPGYLGTRLHRAAGPADFRWVNVARWSSPLMFSRAIARPEFAAAAVPFAAHPALYEVLRG